MDVDELFDGTAEADADLDGMNDAELDIDVDDFDDAPEAGADSKSTGSTRKADDKPTSDEDEITDEDLDAVNAEEDEGDDDKKDSDHDKLTPEQQASVDKRIGKEVAKRKAAEEKRDELESRIAEITAERDELKQQTERAQSGLPVHPDYISPEDVVTIRDAVQLQERQEWLLNHMEEGFDDPSDDSKSMSVAEIRRELNSVEVKLGRIMPKAEDVYRQAHVRMHEDLKTARELRSKYPDADIMKLAEIGKRALDRRQAVKDSVNKEKPSKQVPQGKPQASGAPRKHPEKRNQIARLNESEDIEDVVDLFD